MLYNSIVKKKECGKGKPQRGVIVENKTKNKVRIKIADNIFTVLSDEDDTYTKGLASSVDRTIKALCKGSRTSVTGASMLAAMNYCDEMTKARKELNELKNQLDFYLEELVKQKESYNELLRETKKLRNDIDIYRDRLRSSSPSINEAEPISASVKPVRRKIHVSDSEEAAEDEE